jgi:hypothetical protein
VGDILSPNRFLPQLNSADVIVHTIGTLFDSSVTKGTAAGGAGTYEQVNRDTVVSLLNSLQSPKKIIYLSSNAHPPFLSRYLTTKHEAEALLLESPHDAYCLRPGFIFNAQHRVWSVPVRHSLRLWSWLYPHLHAMVRSLLSRFRLKASSSAQSRSSSKATACLWRSWATPSWSCA